MDGFEVFDRVHSRIVKTPLVTLQARGYISLNLAAFEALKIPKAVELMFNRAERVIGIKKTDPSNLHAVIVRKQPNSPSYMVAGRSFANLYEIDISVARRYNAELRNGVLLVDLKQPGAIATGPNTRESLEKRQAMASAQGPLFEAEDDVLAGVQPMDQAAEDPNSNEPVSQQALELKEKLLEALARLDESSNPQEIETIRAQLGKALGKDR